MEKLLGREMKTQQERMVDKGTEQPWGPQQGVTLSSQHRFVTLAMLSNSTAAAERWRGRGFTWAEAGRTGAL